MEELRRTLHLIVDSTIAADDAITMGDADALNRALVALAAACLLGRAA